MAKSSITKEKFELNRFTLRLGNKDLAKLDKMAKKENRTRNSQVIQLIQEGEERRQADAES